MGEIIYITNVVYETAHGNSVALLGNLAQLDDPNASFQILHLAATTRLNFILKALSLVLAKVEPMEYDSSVEPVLAAIVSRFALL